MSMESQLGGQIWNLMPWGSVEKSVTRAEESFRDVMSDNFKKVFSGKERYCKGIEFFL